MVHHIRRYLLVGLVVVSAMVGSVGQFGSTAAAQEPQFSAAYAVVEQEGSVGRWAFLEPPGSTPVTCAHFEPFGSSVRQIYYDLPIVYAAIAAGQQEVTMRVEFQRRLPDGSLKDYLSSDTIRGYPENDKPVGGERIAQNADNGSTIVASVDIDWYGGTTRTGHVRLRYSQYQTIIAGTPHKILPVTDACKPGLPATATLGVTQGTVNATVPFTLKNFAGLSGGTVAFDGKAVGSISTDVIGRSEGAFVVPAAPMGNHTVKVTSPYGPQASATFTVKPRIKLIPNAGLKRGLTVNVSLRGYAKYEVVRIRWKKGTSWVEVGQVKTSGTGSANVYVKVPTFAVDGLNSVRGDGSYGHAQTNAVYVGPVTVPIEMSTSATATPTAIPTKTPTPVPTASWATATPIPTATPSPTVEVTTPEPTATPTVTETATPLPVTETPTPEPTAESTTESSPGATAPGEEVG